MKIIDQHSSVSVQSDVINRSYPDRVIVEGLINRGNICSAILLPHITTIPFMSVLSSFQHPSTCELMFIRALHRPIF